MQGEGPCLLREIWPEVIAFDFACLPAYVQIELAGRGASCVREISRICRKRERNLSQFIDPHPRRNSHCRDLCNLYRSFANNVTAQYLRGLAIDNELAKSRPCAHR